MPPMMHATWFFVLPQLRQKNKRLHGWFCLITNLLNELLLQPSSNPCYLYIYMRLFEWWWCWIDASLGKFRMCFLNTSAMNSCLNLLSLSVLVWSLQWWCLSCLCCFCMTWQPTIWTCNLNSYLSEFVTPPLNSWTGHVTWFM
jgi:hypothetical protein